jgi:thiamine-phosphate pyrophosphorylase
MKEQFGIYLIATNPAAGYEVLARAAVSCHVRYLQLRMKEAARHAILETARMYRDITGGTQTRFIVNDDLSIAMETDADGIHLGQTDQSPAEARREWDRPGKLFGLSTHSMEQAAAALVDEPDYIGIGPAFPTRTKADADPALGVEETGRIARETARTAVAIGGITAVNLPDLLAAGVENFGVIGAVNSAPDPAAAIRRLQAIWKKHLF